MPAHKKDPSTRRRQNKASTAATLKLRAVVDYRAMTVADLRAEIDRRNEDRPPSAQLTRRGTKAELADLLQADDMNRPALPDRDEGWHSQTREWWDDIWSSPMSDEWDDSDDHNLFVLAAIYDDIWRAKTATARKEAAVEYRLQRADLGLSPYSRRRLEWTIESADEAKDKGDRRRAARTPQPKTGKGQADPRGALSDAG